MYKFALYVVLLLHISGSALSQRECGQFYCLPIGAQCLYHEQCTSTYCDLYSRADENEYGSCATPPPNWGHCKFENEDCTSNEECCTGNCYTLTQYNISYCNPPIRAPTPPIVFAPAPSPSDVTPNLGPTLPPLNSSPPSPVADDIVTPTPAPNNTPPSPVEDDIFTPTPAPNNTPPSPVGDDTFTPTPAPNNTPPAPVEDGFPTTTAAPAPAPSNVHKKLKTRKLKHPKFHGKGSSAPPPC